MLPAPAEQPRRLHAIVPDFLPHVVDGGPHVVLLRRLLLRLGLLLLVGGDRLVLLAPRQIPQIDLSEVALAEIGDVLVRAPLEHLFEAVEKVLDEHRLDRVVGVLHYREEGAHLFLVRQQLHVLAVVHQRYAVGLVRGREHHAGVRQGGPHFLRALLDRPRLVVAQIQLLAAARCLGLLGRLGLRLLQQAADGLIIIAAALLLLVVVILLLLVVVAAVAALVLVVATRRLALLGRGFARLGQRFAHGLRLDDGLLARRRRRLCRRYHSRSDARDLSCWGARS
mmetsp:Transcript_14913/g.36645  ORF Transcript_14913/g.36645 Transcript_14913/m.36645 type:complete len:282 (+) Transcript_14913:3224-4069(+)